MKRQNNQLWIGGAVFLCVLVLLGTYFLGAKPRFDSAAEMDEERSQVEMKNANLTREVASLRELEATLPEVRQAIGALQVGIPTEAKLDEFSAYLGQLAIDHSVTIVSVTAVQPLPITIETPAPEPTPEPTDASTEAPVAGEGTASATPAAATPILEGLAGISAQVVVVGTSDNAQAFLDALQTVSPRHFMASGVTIEAVLVDTPAAAGLPALVAGEVMMTVGGALYVLPGIVQPEAPAAEVPAPLPLPVPAPGANPFAPFAGIDQ